MLYLTFPTENLSKEPAGNFMLYSSGTTGRPKGILKPLPTALASDENNAIGALQKQLWGFDENTSLSFAFAALSFRTRWFLHWSAIPRWHRHYVAQVQRVAGSARNSGL